MARELELERASWDGLPSFWGDFRVGRIAVGNGSGLKYSLMVDAVALMRGRCKILVGLAMTAGRRVKRGEETIHIHWSKDQ